MIPILLVAYLFLGIYHNISIWYKLSDKTHFGAIISIIGALITFIVSYIFIPISGYIAFAFANLLCYLFMLIMAYYWGQKHYPIFYPLTKIIRSVLLIIAILIVAFFIDMQEWFFLKYIAFVGLLIGYSFYAYSIEKAEWHQLFSKNRS